MAKSRVLLNRLLDTRDLPTIVSRLEPEILHRVIQTCGLEACAELLALATPEQLGRVLDADVWRARRPGTDEEFDADRFGLWLTVLMQAGVEVAVEKLIGLDTNLVIAGVAHHIAAFDYAATSSYVTLDGQHVPGRRAHDGLVSELGGCLIEAIETSAWDAIVDVLAWLDAEHPEYFHRVMRGCIGLSGGPREENGFHDLLDDRDQDMFDLASGRDASREERGYVAPSHARAFLREGRDLRLDAARPAQSAIARASLEAVATHLSNTDANLRSHVAAVECIADTAAQGEADGVAAILALLEEAGLPMTRSRALPAAPDQPDSGLSFVRGHAASHPASEQELAYLVNTILAGASVQGRAFTVREATDCAAGICNLGLENWPPHWPDRDLTTAFQVGWTILHREVSIRAAERSIEVLTTIRCRDREIQLRLDGLRRTLIRHVANREPWHAADALDVILALDAPSWAALRGLIDECPVIHAALRASRQRCRSINPTDFEFISERRQIAAVHEFLAALPSLLTR